MNLTILTALGATTSPHGVADPQNSSVETLCIYGQNIISISVNDILQNAQPGSLHRALIQTPRRGFE
jgi:hypothetical protein